MDANDHPGSPIGTGQVPAIGTGQVPAQHWAPPQIVLARRRFTLVGALGAAAAAGRSGTRLWSVAPVPAAPGLFALVQDGAVRHVGASRDLASTFARHGLGEVSGRDPADPADADLVRLHEQVTTEVLGGRPVDLYVLVAGPAALVTELAALTGGAWQGSAALVG